MKLRGVLKCCKGGRGVCDESVESALIAALIPSLFGMLVQRNVTSIVIRMVLCGGSVGIRRMVLRKCVVSLMYEGTRGTRGLR